MHSGRESRRSVLACIAATLTSILLSACGSASDTAIPSVTSASHSGAVNNIATSGTAASLGTQAGSAPVFYDPATRFNNWGSSDPRLKTTPAYAQSCEIGQGATDQDFGRFRVYANNCVMSYQVSPPRFEQMLQEGEFFATELLEQFSQTFKDEFDFVVFSIDTPGTQPAVNFQYFGQYHSLGTRVPTRIRRLMGHIQLPFGVDPIINGPFLHEVFHEWGQRATLPDMGFDEGHWGHVSTQGQLGGFDASTLLKTGSTVNAAGQTIYSYQAGIRPFHAVLGLQNPNLCTNFTRGYGPIANGGNGSPLGPFELFMMGLLPANQVAPLIRLNNPVWKRDIFYGPAGPGNARSVVSVVEATGESIIDIDTIRQRLGASDPEKQAKQTEFRVAYVTITSKPSLDAPGVTARQREATQMALQGHVDSNLYLGCVTSYNLFTATKGLATIAFGGLREARR